MEHDLTSAKASLVRVKLFQEKCGRFMSNMRGTVGDDTYDVLSDAYSVTGNAARELRILIEEIEKLNNQ